MNHAQIDHDFIGVIQMDQLYFIYYSKCLKNMWLYLQKPDLFTHEFWPIFQTLNHHNYLYIIYNDFRESSYLPV